MIASEFAFLALGLVLGVASGAALVMVLGSRPPVREVRLTVSHDAVPRRSATLSSDAFLASAAEPARGGPADRRFLDRADDHDPVTAPWSARRSLPERALGQAWPGSRTPVLSGAVASGNVAGGSVGIEIFPERDPLLDALRVQAAIAATRMHRADLPASAALLEILPIETATRAAASTATGTRQGPPSAGLDRGNFVDAIDETPALTRILRGDHHALSAAVATLAGEDLAARRAWETELLGVTGAIVGRTIDAGCLDFPVGNPFWDTFTTAQCRDISGALGAAGHRFDGIDGWADGRVPSYRDLTYAVAAIGLEPRRIRAWPTQDEIADLYLEVTSAPDDYLQTTAPNLDLEEIQALVGGDGSERERIWSDWDRVRAVLLERISPEA